jgi:formylmethanofuran dehydrogenase subunit B
MQKLKSQAGQKKMQSAMRIETATTHFRPQTCPIPGMPQTMNKEGRKLIVVDVRKTMSAEMADYFIQVEPNKDYELMQALRVLVTDGELDVDQLQVFQLNTSNKSRCIGKL